MRNIKQKIKTLIQTSFFLGLICSSFVFAADKASDHSKWNQWVNEKAQDSDSSIVQNRQIKRAQHFQLVGPLGGPSYRDDLHQHWNLSLAGRYFFSEEHGIEFLRVSGTFTPQTDTEKDILQKSNYSPDVKLSHAQVSAAYIFTPIYGKYAWNSKNLVYFDMFALLGPGVRFVAGGAPLVFLETGIGMGHHFNRTFGVIFEWRVKTYSEKRSTNVLIVENGFQLGTSFLF